MDRAEKSELVATLNTAFKEAGALFVVHYKGLTVAEITALRNKVRETSGAFKVAKNRLVKLAIRDTDYAPLEELFIGPTALVYSNEAVSLAKALVDFAKTNDRLVVIGGGFAQRKLSAGDIEQLSKLPSLDQLRGTLVGLLVAPATRIATLAQAPAAQLARVLNAYAQKDAA